ncbi:MAG: amidase [Actinomycetota bacterium]
MSDTDLAFASALEQADLVRRGEVSPVELVELYANRIEKLNPELNAYVTPTLDRALDEARGLVPASGGGAPFHGVPISIKDLNDTAGVRTTQGSAAFADRVPEQDDDVVAALKRAGFIVLGKTNTPEFGNGPWTDPLAYGSTRNPWDVERTSGGSSGGAAAALAAGLCPISQGSDGGGSIRIPSSCCGLFGLKPTRGRVAGPSRPASTLSTNGPIARTVADAAAILDVIAGPSLGDAWWVGPHDGAFLDEVRREPGRLRVAFTTESVLGVPVAPGNRRAVEDAAKLLEELGHEVAEEVPPWTESVMHGFFKIWCVGIAAREPVPDLNRVEPLNRVMIEEGRRVSAAEFLATWTTLHRQLLPVVRFFDRHDVLLTPTVATPPVTIGQFRDPDQPLNEFFMAGTFAPFTSIWNTTGQPGVSVPLAWDEHDLPAGVQIVGRPAEEATLIRLSAQLEAARPWRDRRPPVS